MNTLKQARIAQFVEALRLTGIEVRPVAGPFGGSDAQIVIRLPNRVEVSVMTDADTPALFELVLLGDEMQLVADKLTLQLAVERIGELARPQPRTPESASHP